MSTERNNEAADRVAGAARRTGGLVEGHSNAAEVTWAGWVGLWVNLLLSIVKLAVGATGNCRALLADGVHSLSDMATDLALVVGARYWSAPADAGHPHGHGRLETLTTLFIGLALAGVGVGLIVESVSALAGEPETTLPSVAALAAAVASIVVKEALYQWTVAVGRRCRSSAVIANAWHHRSDAMSSLPVAVAVAGSLVWPNLKQLDSIAAVVVSVWLLKAAWEIARPALDQLMDGGARAEEREAMLRLATETPGVKAVHALRSRYIGPGLQVDVHVLVAPETTVAAGHGIGGQVKRRIMEAFPEVVDLLVHLEPYDPEHPCHR